MGLFFDSNTRMKRMKTNKLKQLLLITGLTLTINTYADQTQLEQAQEFFVGDMC